MTTFNGTAADETFSGGLGADQLFGAGGDDRLAGAQGQDLLEGGDGADILGGQGGDDTVRGDGGDDLIFGGPGSNGLFGGAGDDTIDGSGGRNTMAGGDGADSIIGDNGGDHIYSGDTTGDLGTEVDTLRGEGGSDTILAGVGDNADGGPTVFSGSNDTLDLDLRGATAGVTADLRAAFTGGVSMVEGGALQNFTWIGWVRGSAFDDFVDVTEAGMPNLQPSTVWGGEGDDTVVGGVHRTIMDGEAGDDLLSGGGGDDTLLGGDGADTLDAGAGFSNLLKGGVGADSLLGGGAGDEIFSDDLSGMDLGLDADTVHGGDGADTITAGLGDDADGGGGKDTLFLDFRASASGLRIDLSPLFADGAVTIAGGVLQDFEKLAWLKASEFRDVITVGVAQDFAATGSPGVYGGGGDDLLNGSAEHNELYGDAGDDLLKGQGGNDQVRGGDGDDSILGGAGDDVLVGYAGADRLAGGDGDDFLVSHVGPDLETTKDTLTGGAGDDYLLSGYGDDAGGGSGTDALSVDLRAAGAGVTLDISAVFQGGSVMLAGGVLTDFERYSSIHGSDFDDRITVGDARSFGDRGDVDGGLGDDTLVGGRRANELFGGEGRDELHGLAGADTLEGGAGADRLAGGSGADRMTGGAGADKFVFLAAADSPAGESDLITDLAGEDLISLRAIDADPTREGDQRFDLVAGPDLLAGQATLVFVAAMNRTELRLEIDGVGAPDVVILLAGDQTGFVNFAL